MNALSDYELSQETVRLSGTMPSGYTVRVNGELASGSYGSWWLDVPRPSGGSAFFVVAAYPPGHDLDPAAAHELASDVEMPARIIIEEDAQNVISKAAGRHEYLQSPDGPVTGWATATDSSGHGQ